MVEPVSTIGMVVAAAYATGATACGGFVSEAAKDAWRALRDRLTRWAAGDVEALEKTPLSDARKAVLAEAVNARPAEEQAEVKALAAALIAALKAERPVGLDVERLQALEVELGAITVTEGTGARFGEVTTTGAFKVGPIIVGTPPGKTPE